MSMLKKIHSTRTWLVNKTWYRTSTEKQVRAVLHCVRLECSRCSRLRMQMLKVCHTPVYPRREVTRLCTETQLSHLGLVRSFEGSVIHLWYRLAVEMNKTFLINHLKAIGCLMYSLWDGYLLICLNETFHQKWLKQQFILKRLKSWNTEWRFWKDSAITIGVAWTSIIMSQTGHLIYHSTLCFITFPNYSARGMCKTVNLPKFWERLTVESLNPESNFYLKTLAVLRFQILTLLVGHKATFWSRTTNLTPCRQSSSLGW